MPEKAIATEKLDSWKEIASYLGRNERTVIRWEKERGLPIHRIPGGLRQGVFAYRSELDRWLAGKDGSEWTQQDPTNGIDLERPSPIFATPVEEESTEPRSRQRGALRGRTVVFLTTGSLGVLLILMAVNGNLDRLLWHRNVQFASPHQITADGQEKESLLTDGKTLFFAQEQDGWCALSGMSVEGGPIRVVWSPPANVFPLDISPDGRKLLASTSLGRERERKLWIVPLDGGKPRQLPNIVAHTAAWAPDGKTIAFAAGNGIYLTSEGGAAPREIGAFPAFSTGLLWTQDGEGLRFLLKDIPTDRAKLWGQISGEGMKTTTLRPLPPSIGSYERWSPATEKDSYFLSEEASIHDNTPIWLVRYGRKWWESPMQAVSALSVPGRVFGLAYSKELSRLFVLSEPQNRAAFLRFGPKAQGFQQILPGVSGVFLDYSRDGGWVTYTSIQDGVLWVSRADGSAARKITSPPDIVALPRWSPDGTQIAYTHRRPDQPWRIYVFNLKTGAAREASGNRDSQGAPTWSADGRFLAYGNVNCEQTNSCAIHRINLATRGVETLPRSEGLFTARWSPDGRFIAAFHLAEHEVLLFDVRSGKWHKLADAVAGSDLSWSADSNYLYANVPGTDARIVRIRITDGYQETVLDLPSQDKFDMAEADDLQFSLAPDDAVILHRRIHSQEIFAYDLR
jgi:Tol biopolymer transport system component